MLKTKFLPFLVIALGCLALTSAFGQIKIMPLGDSITKGAVDPAPSLSGFRAQLFKRLNESKVKYLFVGCTDNNSSNEMKLAGQQFHNGYGS